MKVSCLVVTQESRWEHFQRACGCFLRQTWPDKELVIAAYGAPTYLERLARFCDQLPAPTATSLTTTPTPLGQLRNMSVQAATGDAICQWDDDDLYHPLRIEIQTRALVDEEADFCLLSDYWHYFADTGELYWVDCRHDGTGQPFPWPHLQTLPGSLTARREAMFAYTPNERKEDSLLLAYAAIRRCRFSLVHGAGWCYVYAFHGGNTWERKHHEDFMRRRVFSAGAVEALTERARATFDPKFSVPAVLAQYELAAAPVELKHGRAA